MTAASPSTRARVATSIGVAVAAAAISYMKIRELGYATDFAWTWVAGRAVLKGEDPYVVVQAGGPYHFDAGFMYPLPAAVAAAPLGALPIFPASIVFAAICAGALAFAMTRDGWWRLPSLMSFPMLWAVSAGQWSPVVAAAALSSGFAWAAACKPTLGFAAFLSRPSWRFLCIGAVFTAVAFLFNPTWPLEWIRTTQTRSPGGSYHVPLLVPGGVLLLLSALRWRTAEGRLLIGMSVVPQTMLLYDQVSLGLLARSRMQSIVFGLWSYLVVIAVFIAPKPSLLDKAQSLHYMAYIIVWLYYLPALAVVLSRRNEGPAPAWLERLVRRWPAWLRGIPA